jgi:hypothetical protein
VNWIFALNSPYSGPSLNGMGTTSFSKLRHMTDLMERLMRDTEWVGDCLVWTGAATQKGYGQLTVEQEHWLTHRLSWTLHHGPPPRWVLHTCDNPPCVNPEHLFDGSCADNNADKMAKGRWRGGRPARSHCIHGHELSNDNVYVTPDGRRQCRICRRKRNLDSRRRLHV